MFGGEWEREDVVVARVGEVRRRLAGARGGGRGFAGLKKKEDEEVKKMKEREMGEG